MTFFNLGLTIFGFEDIILKIPEIRFWGTFGPRKYFCLPLMNRMREMANAISYWYTTSVVRIT